MVLVGVIVGVCVLLLILGFLLPRLSRYPQRGVDRATGAGQRGASHAPGRFGRWLQRPFSLSRRAADRSAGAGRKGRAEVES